jgi:DNA gyrase subunit A
MEAAEVQPPPQQQQQQTAADSSSSSGGSVIDGPWLLLVTSRGYGKRVLVKDVPLKLSRGTQGVIGVKLEKGDRLAVVLLVTSADDDVALASRQGMVTRLRASDVRVCGRSARGVRVISLNEGDEVQTVTVVPAEHRTALA